MNIWHAFDRRLMSGNQGLIRRTICLPNDFHRVPVLPSRVSMSRSAPGADVLARRRTLRAVSRSHQQSGAATRGHWCARLIIKTTTRVCRRRLKIAHSLATSWESLRVGNQGITRTRANRRYSISKSAAEPGLSVPIRLCPEIRTVCLWRVIQDDRCASIKMTRDHAASGSCR
jgi:hypothetical protein